MALNSLFKVFLPKDRVFFQLFEEVGGTVEKMSKKLRDVVRENDFDRRATLISEIEDLEHVNDDLTHKIFTELGRNFITPFDREDIHYLATALDDIADCIYASAKKINLYRVNPSDSGIQKLVEMIEYGCTEIKQAVCALRNLKNVNQIKESLIKINGIENQADDIFEMSIDMLFTNETNPIEVIKKREIYQVMELVTDKCEDASNVIESILIKYA